MRATQRRVGRTSHTAPFQRRRFSISLTSTNWAETALSLSIGVLVPLAVIAAGAPLAAEKKREQGEIERGRYLATFASCNDCHTPWKFNQKLRMPEQDWSRRLSGHPAGAPDPVSELKPGDMGVLGPSLTSFRMPFGVVYAANLTPDKATGLGEWTKKMFVSAMRKGTHLGGDGRVILPPMPWTQIGQMSDADLRREHPPTGDYAQGDRSDERLG